jgi:hypothetical protein
VVWCCNSASLPFRNSHLYLPNVRFMLTTMTNVSQAASLMGKKSAHVRQKKWGKKAFVAKMREWGKLGGRPKGSGKKSKKGGKK